MAFTTVLFGLWSWNEHIQYPAQYLEHTPNVGKNNYQHYEDGPYVAGCYEFDPLNLYKTLGDGTLHHLCAACCMLCVQSCATAFKL